MPASTKMAPMMAGKSRYFASIACVYCSIKGYFLTSSRKLYRGRLALLAINKGGNNKEGGDYPMILYARASKSGQIERGADGRGGFVLHSFIRFLFTRNSCS